MSEPARRVDRSTNFSDMMSEMISTALRLIKDRQGQLPSIAVLAHAMKMNRTTAYYYFQSPEALRTAITAWTIGRLMECLSLPDLQPESLGEFIRFVFDNPYAVNLLLEDLLSLEKGAGDLGWWDELVGAMQQTLRQAHPGMSVDAEVHVAWFLGGALNGPRLLQKFSKRDGSTARIVERFRSEERRLIPCALAA